MEILVIAQNLENTAPGSVFKNIINGLAIYNTVDLLYDGELDTSKIKNIRDFYSCQSNKYLDYIGRRFLLSKGKENPLGKWWSDRAVKMMEGKKYNIVCVMLTSSYYYPLLCGEKIAQNSNSKYAVYSVDAIPAPGWGESDFSRFQSKLIRSELKHCDYFATINPKMLKYQLSTFEHKPGLKSGVIYIPIDGKIKQLEKVKNKHVFLYTGGVYGKRKIDKIIMAFNRICEIHSDAKLLLVGSHLQQSYIESIAGNNVSSIKLIRYTKDLSQYYEEASVFINIDADVPDDVFLASKLMKYLPYNRQILCETGQNSPTHLLLDGLETVIICDHDEDELYQGMIKAIKNIDTADYSERNTILKELSIEEQGKRFSDELKSIV